MAGDQSLMELVEYPDREAMMVNLAGELAGELADCLRRHDRATLCIPGGTTPGPVFDALSSVDIDWARVSVVLNDERWVPESASRSNTRLLKARLLRDRAAKATLIPLYADAPAPEEKLDQLIAGLDGHLPISVLLLGMGTDMHTASLFPDADQLELALSDDAPPLLAMRSPNTAEPRVTLTVPVLVAAMNTHILITGHAKRTALEAAQHMTPQEAPVRAMLPNARVHWAE